MVRLCFERNIDPKAAASGYRCAGAILDGAGRRILSVTLKLNNIGGVATTTPLTQDAGIFRIIPTAIDAGFCSIATWPRAASGPTHSSRISGLGELEIARPSIVSRGGRWISRRRSDHPDIVEEEFWEILPKVWPLAFQETLLYNLRSALAYVLRTNIPGDFIECGVFMGGCVMMMAEMCKRHDRSASLSRLRLDTFNGFARVDATLDVDVRTGLKLPNKVLERTSWNDRPTT